MVGTHGGVDWAGKELGAGLELLPFASLTVWSAEDWISNLLESPFCKMGVIKLKLLNDYFLSTEVCFQGPPHARQELNMEVTCFKVPLHLLWDKAYHVDL